MVLLKGKPVILEPPKRLPVDLNRQVYLINETGEWFTNYNEYIERLTLLQDKQYETELSGMKQLNYFEAIRDDETNLKYLLEKLSIHLAMPLTDFIYDIKELDLVKLVDRCESFLSKNFVIDEHVKFYGHTDDAKIYKIVSQHTFEPVMDKKGEKIIIPSYKRYLITRELNKKEIANNLINNSSTGQNENNGNLEQLVVDETQIMKVEKPLSRFVLAMFCKLLYCHPDSTLLTLLKDENIQLYATIRNWNDQFLDKNDRLTLKVGDINNVTARKIESKAEKKTNETPASINGKSDNKSENSANNEALNTDENNKRSKDQMLNNNDDSAFDRAQKKLKETKLMDELVFRLPTLNELDSLTPRHFQTVPDLTLLFQGPLDIFHGVKIYTDNWESLSYEEIDCILDDKPQMFRLLEVYCFLNSFAPILKLNYFNFDDMLTSLKCTDSRELAGEIVSFKFKDLNNYRTSDKEVTTSGSESSTQIKSENTPSRHKDSIRHKGKRMKIVQSNWKRNSKIRKFIQDKETEHLKYEIVFNINSTSNTFTVDEHPGTKLIIEIFTRLLSMIVDSSNNWRCDIVEEWHDNKDSEESDSHMEKVLNTVLNYRGINWVQRLAKRQFENGNWLIILLGVLQDTMHISKYEQISNNFTKKIIPNSISVAMLHKQMFVNFCSKFTLSEKIDLIWALSDIVLSFSKDIKTWIDDTTKLKNNISLESSKTSRLRLGKLSDISSLQERLKNVRETIDSDNKKQLINELENSINLANSQVFKIYQHEKYLVNELEQLFESRLQSLGNDKFGNRYYWLEVEANISNALMKKNNHELYFSSRLWITGPERELFKVLFDIEDEQYNKWCDLAKTKGKVFATREVFRVYQNEDGAFFKIEQDDVHVEIVNSEGVLSKSYELTQIEKKIIDETPSKLLISSNEWYFIDDFFIIKELLTKFNTLGMNELFLYNNLNKFLKKIKHGMELKEIQTGGDYYDSLERSLLKELTKYETIPKIEYETEFDRVNAEMLESRPLDLTNIDIGKLLENGEELKSMAKELMYLHESDSAIKIYEQVMRLEKERLKIVETQLTILTQDVLGIRTELFSPHTTADSVSTEYFRKQMDILTDLLNYRHFNAIKHVTEWSNKPNPDQIDDNFNLADYFKQKWNEIQEKTAEIESLVSKTIYG